MNTQEPPALLERIAFLRKTLTGIVTCCRCGAPDTEICECAPVMARRAQKALEKDDKLSINNTKVV